MSKSKRSTEPAVSKLVRDMLYIDAQWEYKLLVQSLEEQGDNPEQLGDLDTWFNEVYMKEEGWREIREAIINEYDLIPV